MNKISIIIRREYMTRVRKKSFIIMTLLAPILIAGLVVVPSLLMMNSDKEHKKIAVVQDGTDLFTNVIPNTKDEEFVYLKDANINELKNNFEKAGYYGILYLSPELITTPNAVQLISKKQPPIGLLDHISNALEKEIEKQKLLAYHITDLDDILKNVRTKISIQTIKINDAGQATQTSTGITMALAYISGFLMYMLVFMFGVQVMRGVIEEKVNRVVEVVVSSVRPVQLMMGKILGIALVGLTQFLIWIILSVGIISTVSATIMKDKNVTAISRTISDNIMSENNVVQASPQAKEVTPEFAEFSQLFNNALNQDWLLIISSFIFYFVFGYLLYASIFAAIGSAVDNETETQQFMLPITIPIIFGLFVAIGTMQNPESSISFWFSLIPLTSPIVMMARIPFGVPYWQILISIIILILTFLGFVWMAAKVYRTGILMYGKKSSWKEIWKWLRYSG